MFFYFLFYCLSRKTNQFHGAEFYLTRYQALNSLRHPVPLMKPQVSLPYSQEPVNDPCPKPDKSSLYNHFNTGANLHLLLILSRGLFPWGLPTKMSYAYIMLAMRATYPLHLTLKGKLLIRYLPKLKYTWTRPWLFIYFPGNEADHTLSSSVKVKNRRSYISNPIYTFTVCTGATLPSSSVIINNSNGLPE